MNTGDRLKFAVFVSGRGSNMRAIFAAVDRGEIKSEPALVYSNNSESYALVTARERGIASLSVAKLAGPEMLAMLREHSIDFIVLAGYLKLVPAEVVEAYRGRIINIHPALLPRFGGKGYHGINVHRAVLEDMRKSRKKRAPSFRENMAFDEFRDFGAGGDSAYYSGATVHFIDEEYDRGEILVQKKVRIDDLDSAEDIAARVLETEHEIIVEAVEKLEQRLTD